MNKSTDPQLDSCGCCEADVPQPSVYNRPGLPVLTYRVGSHATFLRRMLARLSSQPVPPDDPKGARPLRALTTRANDDPAIALLDAWATVADVLTFYQERIANEGYLRTATERQSLLELARTIGYELNPGVAASAFLAFNVEEAPGAPGIATVPEGTKVQSVPGPGQLPQIFESSKEIVARAEWNALRPRLTRPQELAISRNKLYLLGISTSFAPGTPAVESIDASQTYPLDPTTSLPNGQVQAVEVQHVYLTGTATNLKAGDLLLLVGKRATGDQKTLALVIKRVEVEAELQRTRVDLADAPPKPTFTPPILKEATIKLEAVNLNKTHVDSLVRGTTWRERDLSAFLSIQGWSRRSLVKHINTAPPAKVPPSQLAPTDPGAFAFRARLGFFGHNAPLYKSLPDYVRNNAYPISWDDSGGRSIWKDSQGNPYTDADAYFERSLPEVVSNSWVVLESSETSPTAYRVSAVTEASLADYGLSGRVTGLRLTQADGTTPPNQPEGFKVRKTTAHAQSGRLELADLPIEDPVAKGTTSLQLNRMVLGLQVNQPLILSGERDDLAGVTATEIVVLTDVQHSGGFTAVFFKEPLKYSYVRKTMTLNANVVRATHGETVVEVLGSGDGAQPNQRFTLRKPPLTHVSAATPSGSQSTLELRVNGILWEEAARLFGLNERSEHYIVRIDDDGKSRVTFGDGKTGARLPTGTENVVATYRSGIGLPGMVLADTLTLLQTRPLGVRSVTNPLPASGAADPENRDNARTKAPVTVLTLERIVSLRDFEDFARAFAGIGKAQAVPLWNGEARLVHITIAAAAATVASDAEDSTSALATHVVDRTSPLYTHLVEAVEGACAPAQEFVVDSYQPVFFNVKAKILVDPRYASTSVLPAVETALRNAFSFERRNFGQLVTTAEVVTVIQGVPGVLATDLDQLYRYRDDELPPDPDVQVTTEVLEAEGARWDAQANQIRLAELLLINPMGITLGEMMA